MQWKRAKNEQPAKNINMIFVLLKQITKLREQNKKNSMLADRLTFENITFAVVYFHKSAKDA